MATWRADIKVVDTGSFFPVEVVAGSSGTAKETIQKIYHPILIYNLREVSSRNRSSGTTKVSPGMYWFVGFVFALYIVVTYWYIVVPISIIIGLLWLWVKD